MSDDLISVDFGSRLTGRRTFLKGAGVSVAALAVGACASNPVSPAPGRESVQDIINIAATAEAFAVTALGAALRNAATGKLALNAAQVTTLTAARAEEQAHYTFLIDSGAVPVTTTFTVPDPKIVTDVPTFLQTLIDLEERNTPDE